MIQIAPLKLILIGLGMLVLGVILPFLMVLRILESTLLLNFFAYFVSFFGLLIGFFGLATRSSPKGQDRE